MRQISQSLMLLSILFVALSSCKKYKKGVVEVRTTFSTKLGAHDVTYKAIPAGDNSYEPHKEFVYVQNSNSAYQTIGYYWPDESPKSLGYSHKQKNEMTDETYYSTGNANTPGENGHWASSGSGGNGACPIGTWYKEDCGGDAQGVYWTFNADKTGSLTKKDCNDICSPMVFKFTYELVGTTCKLTYDDEQPIIHCTGYEDSRPPKPSNTSITIECNGNNSITVTSSISSDVFTR